MAAIDQTGLAAFLVLRLVDRFAAGARPTHPRSLDYLLAATRDFVLDLESGAEVELLLATLDAVEARMADAHAIPGVVGALDRYAGWLGEQARIDQATDVLQAALVLRGITRRDELMIRLHLAELLIWARLWEPAEHVVAETERVAQRARLPGAVLRARLVRAALHNASADAPAAATVAGTVVDRAQQTGSTETLAAAYVELGTALASLDRARDALEAFVAALVVGPHAAGNERALIGAANVLRTQGWPAAAEEALASVLHHPAAPQYHLRALATRMLVSADTGDDIGYRRGRKALAALREALSPRLQAECDQFLAEPRIAVPDTEGSGACAELAPGVARLRGALAAIERGVATAQ